MPKVLFIWYKRSKGILEGGGQCSLRNYEMICNAVGKANVDSYYVHDEYKRKTLWGYIRGVFYFFFNYYYGLTPRSVRQIVEKAQGYEYVFIDRSVFGIIAKKLKQSGYKGQVISHFHNVEYLYFQAKLPAIPGRQLIIHAADANDRYTCEYSDKIVVLNKRDADLIAERYGRKADALVPISMKDRLDEVPTSDVLTRKKPLCLFLGSYFPPNNEGILWFVEHVLPHTNIQMQIVGKGMAKLKQESPQLHDIEVVSDAPDLRPYLENADIMVLPIFSGSGMKVKTCESLMYGKNIVGTTEAFEGYDVDYQQVGGLCNTAEEFIRCLQNFAELPRPRFNQYARKQFLSNYSYTAIESVFRQLFSDNSTPAK